jgi:predicted SPOUT superfamily RNA methylase MTH1
LVKRRCNKISLALPSSLVSEHKRLREKTEVVAQVGRSAAIYRVDEIIIYPDEPDESLLLKYLLGYMETPQYLRKYLIKKRPELRYAGILPPLRTLHHPTEDHYSKLVEGDVREGVVTDILEKGYHVDIGVNKFVEVKGRAPSNGSRVTVMVTQKDPILRGRRLKKSSLEMYWGYDLRGSNYKLCELARGPEFDLTIATSRHGEDFNLIKDEIMDRWKNSQKTLVAFGSYKQGIQGIIKDEGKRAEECFNYIVNTIPDQGTETVRTEEAVQATLAILNTFKDC